MPLVVAGIDEAGYGPTLGPLCVGMSVFRIDDWTPGQPAPDLWSLLSAGVCRKPADKAGRVAVDDSKKLKGANSRITRHPLADLERGVLAFQAQRTNPASHAPDLLPVSPDAEFPSTDQDFYKSIGVTSEPHDWYAGDPLSLPLGSTAEQLRIAANLVGRACASARVNLLDMRCRSIGEAGFNRIIERTGTKSAATGAGVTRHLRTLWNQYATIEYAGDGGARVICDAQGGRTNYAEYLALALPGSRVTAMEQSPARSRYLIEGTDPCEISDLVATPAGESGVPADFQKTSRALTITFMPEADSAHLPVALASMLAKLVRELMMLRFNRYWCSRLPDLKPTAGYALDARRWLSDVGTRASKAERATLIRRA